MRRRHALPSGGGTTKVTLLERQAMVLRACRSRGSRASRPCVNSVADMRIWAFIPCLSSRLSLAIAKALAASERPVLSNRSPWIVQTVLRSCKPMQSAQGVTHKDSAGIDECAALGPTSHVNVAISAPVSRFHTLSILSSEAETAGDPPRTQRRPLLRFHDLPRFVTRTRFQDPTPSA